jgi:hypothetical protein
LVFFTRDCAGFACCASKATANMNTDTITPQVRIITPPSLCKLLCKDRTDQQDRALYRRTSRGHDYRLLHQRGTEKEKLED